MTPLGSPIHCTAPPSPHLVEAKCEKPCPSGGAGQDQKEVLVSLLDQEVWQEQGLACAWGLPASRHRDPGCWSLTAPLSDHYHFLFSGPQARVQPCSPQALLGIELFDDLGRALRKLHSPPPLGCFLHRSPTESLSSGKEQILPALAVST